MTWFLILIGVAIVVSPLMWFRQSPRQKLVTELRRQAHIMGLQVSLDRRPDAREEETRLECVRYSLPWLDEDCRQAWVLHRYSQRGWQPDSGDLTRSGWLWTIAQAPPQWDGVLADSVGELPAGATAVIANKVGIGVIWDEREDSSDLEKVANFLKKMQQIAKKFAVDA